MVPYTNEDFGIRGVVPAGWVEFVDGGYKRAASDDVALYQQVADGGATVEGVLTALSGDLGLNEPPEPTGSMDTDAASWSLYAVEAQGQSFDIAVADHGGLGRRGRAAQRGQPAELLQGSGIPAGGRGSRRAGIEPSGTVGGLLEHDGCRGCRNPVAGGVLKSETAPASTAGLPNEIGW